jgi:PKD repeat protein
VSFTNTNDPASSVGGLQPGTYTLFWSVTEGNCQAVDSLQVLVNVQPFAAFSYAIAGLTVTFSNVSQFATSWQWDFGDGNTSVLQNPTHSYTSSGVYNVCLIATDTCGSDASCQAINISLLGNAAVQPSTVSVWPNPFQDDLWIADLSIQDEPLRYEIYDANGRVMLQGGFESWNGPHRLALSSLAPGMYLISIRLGQRQSVHKILKD